METIHKPEIWNKGKLIGQKLPLKPKDIWAIRIYLQNKHAVRDLAMFNLAIDSKLRGCDLVRLHVRDVTNENQILSRAMVNYRFFSFSMLPLVAVQKRAANSAGV